MKILLISVLTLININLANSQNTGIEKLENIKSELLLLEKQINDSLEKIEIRLNYLKSKDKKFTSEELEYTRTLTSMEAKIKNKPSLTGDVIGFIPKTKLVKVYGYFDSYYLIEKDSIRGYTNQMYLSENIVMTKWKKENDINEIKKKYGESIAEKISNNLIWIGMTKEMAKLSIGIPNDINRSKGSWGTHEQWVYDNRYLYFENGELTSWQD